MTQQLLTLKQLNKLNNKGYNTSGNTSIVTFLLFTSIIGGITNNIVENNINIKTEVR